MNRPSPQHLSPHFPAILRELILIAATVCVFFALAAYIDLSEKMARFVHGYELWQLDELPLTLLLLSVALCWFSLRRAREAECEVQERIAAQTRVTELLAHNRDLAQRLILAQENERRALARELHDELGQNCTAIRAEASYILHAAKNGDAEASPEIKARISASASRIAVAAETLYAMVRDMLGRLRPANLDSLGLESALQELCERWEEQSGVACGFFPRDVPSQLDDASSVTVLRLVQEALTNIMRHASASQVRITLQPTATALLLSIEDDGCGMANVDAPQRGFGMTGMRERVAALHGEIRFVSAAGKGIQITVELPTQGART